MPAKSLKGMFVSLLAATMLMVFSSSVWAASIINPGSGKSGGDYEMERDIEGGIHIECLGIEFFGLFQGLKDSAFWTPYIFAQYAVISEDDIFITIGNDADLFDNEGRQFKCAYSIIGGQSTDRKEIISGVRTIISAAFIAEGVNVREDDKDKYKVESVYPRLTLVINGKKLTFRDVPGKN